MPSRNVSFNRLAVLEYREARGWYAQRSVEAAARFVAAVDAAVQRIVEAPETLPYLEGKYRRVRLEKFPYLLVFYVRAEHEMRIVAVVHTSRRPGYWRRRS
jgi:plasmid stabilization system protein ParE